MERDAVLDVGFFCTHNLLVFRSGNFLFCISFYKIFNNKKTTSNFPYLDTECMVSNYRYKVFNLYLVADAINFTFGSFS